MKSKKQSVNFDLPLSDSVRGKSTVDGLTVEVVQMIAAVTCDAHRDHICHACHQPASGRGDAGLVRGQLGPVREGPLAVLRAERDRPASHRACLRGPRRAELAAPFGPALQAAVAEQPSKVGRRASATAQQIPKSMFKSPGPIVQTTGNSSSSPSRRLGASCGLKF